MKVPIYFDFIQTGESNNKYNGISLKLSKKLFPNVDFSHKFLHDANNDIFFVKDDYQEKFYYPIFCGNDETYFNNLTIPRFILNKINELRAKLLIINTYEGRIYDIINIEKYIIKKYDLLWENIVFLTGNKFKFDKIKTVYFNYWERYIKIHNDSPTVLYNKAYNLIFNNDNLREYKFICLQRRPRAYRIALYTELYPYKENGILTLGIGDNSTMIHHEFTNFTNFYTKIRRKFNKMELMNTIPAQYDVNTSNENPAFDNDIEKFYKSYLHIVPETYFENEDNQMFFSEKVYKPVTHFQPFVMFNQTRALSEFKSMGFETFSNIIDESYDLIDDDQQRFYQTRDSILEFIKQDHSTMSKIMKDIFPILVHNYYNLVSRYQNSNENLKAQLILNLYD